MVSLWARMSNNLEGKNAEHPWTWTIRGKCVCYHVLGPRRQCPPQPRTDSGLPRGEECGLRQSSSCCAQTGSSGFPSLLTALCWACPQGHECPRRAWLSDLGDPGRRVQSPAKLMKKIISPFECVLLYPSRKYVVVHFWSWGSSIFNLRNLHTIFVSWLHLFAFPPVV